jgi:hypothetical protein
MAGKVSIEQLHAIGHLLVVRTMRITMVSLVALTWVLLTSHCKIEAMTGFEFLRCSTDVHESSEGSDPCKDAGCCSIESAQYHAPRHYQVTPVVVVVTSAPADRLDLVERSLANQVNPGFLTAAPPELSSSWSFFSRTALPPRAPSLPS